MDEDETHKRAVTLLLVAAAEGGIGPACEAWAQAVRLAGHVVPVHAWDCIWDVRLALARDHVEAHVRAVQDVEWVIGGKLPF